MNPKHTESNYSMNPIPYSARTFHTECHYFHQQMHFQMHIPIVTAKINWTQREPFKDSFTFTEKVISYSQLDWQYLPEFTNENPIYNNYKL